MNFIHAGLLWLGTGAVLPVIIHLLSRQRPKVVPFPAVRFVRRSRQRSVRRTRLKHLLLLLLRMALIVLFALLVARPVLGPAAAAGGGEMARTPAVVLIADDSMSMRCQVGDASWFDEARNRMLDLIQRLPDGVAAGLLPASRPSGKLTHQIGDLAGRAAGLRPTLGGATCWRALEQAGDLLRPLAGSTRDVFLFTDMTRAAWSGLGRRSVDLGQATSFYLVDCAQKSVPNGAIVEVRDEGQPALRGSTLGLRVRVLASRGDIQRTVQLEFGGQPVARRDVSLRAGQETELRFDLLLEEEGHHSGRVRFVGPDGLPADDGRFFTVDVSPGVNVLCVEDDPQRGEESPTYFLRLALNPWAEEGRSPFTVSRAASAALDELSFGPTDVVVLAGAGAVSPDAWRRLGAYVSAGGGLLVFCGPEAGRAYREDYAVGVLGAQVGDPLEAQSDEPFALRNVRPGHRFMQVLEGAGVGLSGVYFTRIRHLSPTSGAEELMSFGEDRPGLLLSEQGGRVAVFASTADDRWGLFARTPAFVPFCQEMVLYLAGRSTGGAARSYSVGAGVPITFEPGDWPTIVRVTPPGAETPEQLMPGTTPGRVTYWETGEPGYYRVELERRDETWTRGFAVNPPAAESRLERVTLEELKESINAGTIEVLQEPGDAEKSASVGGGISELTPYLALVAMVFLLAESLLANRFYRTPPEAAPGEPPA